MSNTNVLNKSEDEQKARHLTHEVRERCKEQGMTTDMAGCHHEPRTGEHNRFVGDE